MSAFNRCWAVLLVALGLAGCKSAPPPAPIVLAPPPVANACGGVSDCNVAACAVGRNAAGDNLASMLTPLGERMEAITSTGYAVISAQQHKVPAQQRLLAIRASKLDAYRTLIEQVYGIYLDSNTRVSDMVVMSDVFRSRVEGLIYGAKVVSINPVSDDTYETTLSLDRQVVNDLRALYVCHLGAKAAANRSQCNLAGTVVSSGRC